MTATCTRTTSFARCPSSRDVTVTNKPSPKAALRAPSRSIFCGAFSCSDVDANRLEGGPPCVPAPQRAWRVYLKCVWRPAAPAEAMKLVCEPCRVAAAVGVWGVLHERVNRKGRCVVPPCWRRRRARGRRGGASFCCARARVSAHRGGCATPVAVLAALPACQYKRGKRALSVVLRCLRVRVRVYLDSRVPNPLRAGRTRSAAVAAATVAAACWVAAAGSAAVALVSGGGWARWVVGVGVGARSQAGNSPVAPRAVAAAAGGGGACARQVQKPVDDDDKCASEGGFTHERGRALLVAVGVAGRGGAAGRARWAAIELGGAWWWWVAAPRDTAAGCHGPRC